MDSVRPTGTPGAAARMASTATRWAWPGAPPQRARARRRSCPGGNMPACQPMVATMLGSLMVQARVMTSPSASATTVQKRAKRSTADVGLPAPLRGEPERRREVVEGHDRVDAPLAQARRTGGGSAPARRGRSHPRPARCGSTRPRSGSCRGPGRRPGRRPPPSGSTSRRQSPEDSAQPEPRRVLEGPPVVVGVAALNLVGRRGRPPGEALGERPSQFRPSHVRALPLDLAVSSGTVSFPDNDVTFLADD